MRIPILCFVVSAILFNVLASLWLRRGMTYGGGNALLSVELLLPIGVSILFYLVAFVSYGVTLSRMPLAMAYATITFGTQIALTLAGTLIGDRLSHVQLAGLAVAMVGVGMMLSGTLRGAS
jgi:multidrug transporter EmrE-like cation transporter